MWRWLRILAPLLVLTIWSHQPLRAQDEAPFVWERFDVEIVLQPDGSLNVAETQVLDVRRSLRKGFREIPLDRVEAIGDISVEEPGRRYARGSGQPHTFSATREDGVARIDWWFPPVSGGTHTFTIRYRVDGAIRVYEGGDQLYWTAVYADRAAPVRASTVTVRFPSDVSAEEVRLAGYPERLAREARLVDPRTAVFTAANIPPEQSFEVRAQFPHGLVAARPPSWQQQADWADWYNQNARPVLNFLLLLATLAIAGLGAVALGGLWYARGRDPAIGSVPTTLSEPPSNLPAGVVGTLVDERADVQDVVATLVDLANRGILRISEERNPELHGSSLDYRLELLKPDPLGLRGYEKTVLASLFRGGEPVVRLSDLKDRFVASIPLFQDQLHAEVARAGLFLDDPERARRRYRSIGTGLLALGLLGGAIALFFLTTYVDLAPLPFVVLAILGGAARWLSAHMPRRTREGALEAARWRAFGRFLREEHDRARLEAERAHLEPWLPYAVALGVDQTWIRNLAAVGTPRPHWYARAGYPPGYGMGGGPVVIMPSPWGWGPGTVERGGYPETREAPTGVAAPRGPQGWSDAGTGGLQGGSDSLADLLNRASDVLSHGGGSGWSGGGWGGGGGSGGGGGGFE